ncbi:hypothetical protein EKD04_024315 [Chloroflexales bacterium ZM16-3]|nr:hypothetical protein [Chloroflexales bacterium ZM16-3]
MNNPFLSRSVLNAHLQQETCQQIFFAALNTADRGSLPPPPSLAADIAQLQQLKRLYGPSVYLLHPAEIERIFRGVTLSIYQAIERLYVDRLGRSITTLTHMLNAMANRADVPHLEPEAVWAIALYLDGIHRNEVEVSFRNTEGAWQIAHIQLAARLVVADGAVVAPSMVVVLDCETTHVLSYRLMRHSFDAIAHTLVLYDALIGQRTPDQDGAAGLRWDIPRRIEVVSEVSDEVRAICQTLDLELAATTNRHPLLAEIEMAWQQVQAALYTPQQLALTFDTYLSTQHGYGPRREAKQRRRAYAGLIGYNRDPAWQMPALRLLLPAYQAVTDAHGQVEHDGLHYADDLLALFPNTPVTLRLSLYSESTAWVYLDGEILCEAKAQELRRRDGTYRDRRPAGSSRLAE